MCVQGIYGMVVARWIDGVFADVLASVDDARAHRRLGDVLPKKMLFHGTRGDWMAGLTVVPPKPAIACAASSYCRAHGGLLGPGQYFSSSKKVAKAWAYRPSSSTTPKVAPRVMRVCVDDTCTDGRRVADLIGARMPSSIAFGCYDCPKRFRAAVRSMYARLDRNVDFCFAPQGVQGKTDLEVAFTSRGLRHGIPMVPGARQALGAMRT